MNLQALLRRAVPHLVVLAFFVAAIATYFNPLVFKGQTLRQGDAGQWAGAAQEVINHRAKYHEEPLWSNGMFSGMPAYVISVEYPGEAVGYIESVMQMGLPYPASILLVALICYYILMLALGQKPPAAALGAIAFTFFTFSFVSIEAGHNSKVRAMAMAPLVLAGIALMYRDKRWLGFALTALGMALHIHAGHYQVTYYLALFCAFIGVGMLLEAVRKGTVGKFVVQSMLLVVAAVVGTGANAGRLLTLQEYAPYSMRGKSELTPKPVADPAQASKPTDGGLDRDYVFAWSNEKMEALTLLVPSMRGGSSGEPVIKGGEVAKSLQAQGYDSRDVQMPYYWGDQPFTSGPVYAGVIVCLLAVLGLTVLPASTSIWLLVAVLFSIMLTWGKHFEAFNFFMYDHFPAYRQFRSVTMAIVIAQWALPWLAVLGLGRFTEMVQGAESEEAKKAVQKKLYTAAGIVGGALVLFWMMPSLAGNFETVNDAQLNNPQLVNALIQDREDLLRSDALRAIVFVVLGLGCLFALLKGWVKPVVAVSALAVLTLVDLWQVNYRYLNKRSFEKNYYEQQFTPTAADERMRQALPYHEYRVLNLGRDPFKETQTSYFHQSLGGYSPAKLRRYQDLIEGPLSENIQSTAERLGKPLSSLDSLFMQAPVLNMLNARFIKYGDNADQVLENPQACGTCWFVKDVKTVNGPDEEIAALSVAGWSPKTTAVVDASKFKTRAPLYNTEGATAKVKDWRSNRITYEATTKGPGLLVMSENFYPKGWTATVDGQPADLLRVDYTLRALDLPAGTHEIVVSFAPESYKIGTLVSTGCSALIYLILGWALFSGYKAYQRSKEGGLSA